MAPADTARRCWGGASPRPFAVRECFSERNTDCSFDARLRRGLLTLVARFSSAEVGIDVAVEWRTSIAWVQMGRHVRRCNVDAGETATRGDTRLVPGPTQARQDRLDRTQCLILLAPAS